MDICAKFEEFPQGDVAKHNAFWLQPEANISSYMVWLMLAVLLSLQRPSACAEYGDKW